MFFKVKMADEEFGKVVLSPSHWTLHRSVFMAWENLKTSPQYSNELTWHGLFVALLREELELELLQRLEKLRPLSNPLIELKSRVP